MKDISLRTNEALIMQQIDENGIENFATLAYCLRLDKKKLSHIITALRQKGLVVISQSDPADMWIRLSDKGRRIVSSLWPESLLQAT